MSEDSAASNEQSSKRQRVAKSSSLPTILLDKLFPPEHQEWLENKVNVVMVESCISSTERAEIQGVLWYGHDHIGAKFLDTFPNLKVVSNFGTGYNHIDCEECVKRSIPVGNTPGVLSETVADFTFAILLAQARDVLGGASRAKQGHLNANMLAKQVSGQTIGIVGLGGIGEAVAKRAAAFSMKVLYHNRNDKHRAEYTFCSRLDELLESSDFVVLSCPVTPETRRMMGAEQFRSMKKGALLVNISRGDIVDHDALVAALQAGTSLGSVALDVTDPEPLPPSHPLLRTEGTALEGRVLVAAHQGSATNETRFDMLKMAVDNLFAGLQGERLPWTVPEAKGLFKEGAPIGKTPYSGRSTT